jgi:hypothetical protein
VYKQSYILHCFHEVGSRITVCGVAEKLYYLVDALGLTKMPPAPTRKVPQLHFNSYVSNETVTAPHHNPQRHPTGNCSKHSQRNDGNDQPTPQCKHQNISYQRQTASIVQSYQYLRLLTRQKQGLVELTHNRLLSNKQFSNVSTNIQQTTETTTSTMAMATTVSKIENQTMATTTPKKKKVTT